MFYDDMQQIASDLLRDFKQGTISYIAQTPGNGPADDPGEPVETATPINGTVRGVLSKYVASNLAVASDLQLTMPADTVVPTITGFVEADGVRYKVVSVVSLPAVGTVAAYVLILRK